MRAGDGVGVARGVVSVDCPSSMSPPPSPIDFLHNLPNKGLRRMAVLQNLDTKGDNLQNLDNKGVMVRLELLEAQS
jgi:hypothetical protein